jgi:hypothetical protein
MAVITTFITESINVSTSKSASDSILGLISIHTAARSESQEIDRPPILNSSSIG